LKSKWKRAALLTVLMGGCFAAGAVASNGIERVDAFLRPDYNVIIDGKATQLDTPILIYNESSYIPVRSVSRLLGANVNWEQTTQSIYINSRFDGQPETPANNAPYGKITMEQGNSLVFNYLGKEYALLSITTDMTRSTNTYYRVTDLSRMGIDTRGAIKYQETKTGDLYVLREDAEKLFKQTPEPQYSYQAVASGSYEADVKEYLLTMANVTIPEASMTGQSIYPTYTEVYFIDKLDDHPGHYALYFRNERYETQVFMVHLERDNFDKLYRKALYTINLDYLPKFFDK
jgi:hypothetical protein